MSDLICNTSNENNQQTMSSKEIAELTGKNHSHVVRDIANMLQSLDLIDDPYLDYYTTGQNRKGRLFILPKDLCLVLVSGYNAPLRLKIIRRWIELEIESQPRIPANFSEALQLAADQAKQLEIQAPKVEYVEKFMDTAGLFTLTAISKKLKIKRKDLIECLVRDKALFRRSKRLEPYTEKVNQGLFEIKAGEKNGHSYLQIYVTPKGCQWIAETYISELG